MLRQKSCGSEVFPSIRCRQSRCSACSRWPGSSGGLHLFNAPDQAHVFHRRKTRSQAFLTGAACAADAMYVHFRAFGSIDAICSVASRCWCMNGACRQWQVQAQSLSLVAHQFPDRNQPESGGQQSAVDPSRLVEVSRPTPALQRLLPINQFVRQATNGHQAVVCRPRREQPPSCLCHMYDAGRSRCRILLANGQSYEPWKKV